MVVVDTSVLFAAADDRDSDHAACVDVVETRPADELLVPATAVVETAWLIADRLGDAAEHRFIASVAGGDVAVIELTSPDYHRCAELLATYEDLHLGPGRRVIDRHRRALRSGHRRPPSTTAISAWYVPATSKPSNSSPEFR